MLTRTVPIADKEIIRALEVRCDPAGRSVMALSTMIGGGAPYLGDFTLATLIAEAKERKIDLDAIKTSIHKDPLTKSALYLRATGEITPDQFQRWWRHVKRTGETAYPPPEVKS